MRHMIPTPPEGTLPSPSGPSPARRRLQTTQELADRRRKRITLGLSLALCVLLVNSIVGENGYLTTVRVRRETAELEAAVARLRLENQRLQQDRRRLLEDPSALEETARGALGLIRPGETLVIYRPAKPAARPSR
jgi:cell division protein FtsB